MSVAGSWTMTMQSPMGVQTSMLRLQDANGVLTGTMSSASAGEGAIRDGTLNGHKIAFKTDVTKPMKLTISFDLTLDGDSLAGTAKPGVFPGMPISGVRAD